MPLRIYDYPNYYDIGFGWNPKKETDFLESCFSRYGRVPTKRILELGCGTGRLLIELAKRGFEPMGVELNPHMIDYARQKARQVGVALELVKADMASFKIDMPIDAAFCAIDTFRYLPDEESARSHLQCVSDSLRSRGIYVVDFNLVGLLNSYPKVEAEEWTIERDGVSVKVAHKIIGVPDLLKRRITERTTLNVTEGSLTKTIDTEDPFRTYTRDEFVDLAKSVGAFEIVAWHAPDFDIEHSVEPGPETERVIAVLRKR